MVKFTTPSHDGGIILEIVDRAEALYRRHRIRDDRMTIHMDISATHANGCPLKLQELLDADDFNFAHDILGIRKHICRTTGKLQNCFLPRFSA